MSQSPLSTTDPNAAKRQRGSVMPTIRGLRKSYGRITENEVNGQLDLLLEGRKWTTVIGAFMESTVVPNA